MGSSSSDTSASDTSESENETETVKNQTGSNLSETNESTETKPKEKKRPCCVCKETRAARDLCFAEKSPNGFEECYKEIQTHKKCMADEGFKI